MVTEWLKLTARSSTRDPGAGVNDKFALVIKRALQSHCTGVLVDKTSTSEELVMNLYLYKPD